MRRLIVLTLLCVPSALLAQATISPGMSRAQVEAALGAPATARTVGEHSYLFYQNACGKACGMNDLVILRSDSVVDAIFRSPDRHYTGQSSSPVEARPQVTRRTTDKALAVKKEMTPAPPAKKAATTPAQGKIRPPAEANDTRPSIPLNEPKMPPPGAKTPTPAKAPAKPDAKPSSPQSFIE